MSFAPSVFGLYTLDLLQKNVQAIKIRKENYYFFDSRFLSFTEWVSVSINHLFDSSLECWWRRVRSWTIFYWNMTENFTGSCSPTYIDWWPSGMYKSKIYNHYCDFVVCDFKEKIMKSWGKRYYIYECFFEMVCLLVLNEVRTSQISVTVGFEFL